MYSLSSLPDEQILMITRMINILIRQDSLRYEDVRLEKSCENTVPRVCLAPTPSWTIHICTLWTYLRDRPSIRVCVCVWGTPTLIDCGMYRARKSLSAIKHLIHNVYKVNFWEQNGEALRRICDRNCADTFTVFKKTNFLRLLLIIPAKR